MSDTLAALRARLVALPAAERLGVLRRLTTPELRALADHWPLWAHDGQAVDRDDWRVWLIRAGRGFGKTRAGAEWVSAIARARPEARIALVGGTMDDVRRVMIEGKSGLIAVARAHEPYAWRRYDGEFHFASGARAYAYSAEVPESLRGPEHDAAWCDEIGKWRRGDAAWDNLLLGLRIGERPQVLVTTTPRPTRLMRRVMAMKDCIETRGRTHDNLHLDAGWVAQMEDLYGGTRLGRQELDGEMIDEVVGALWTRAGLETRRVRAMPVARTRVVVGVDPPASIGGDACGIVVVARGADDLAYVLEDASVSGLSPEGWARAVADCVARHGADRVIAEKNQGGAMVESVLRGADRVMPLTLVHAALGKVARAEPVAALYESGRAWHVGGFPALEDELCGLVVGGGYEGPGRSPDRADALVWAMTALMLGARGVARVRTVGDEP
ncbi:terminase family protein [Sphingomonas sp. PB2P19]|uniref:DNA-packaging protein n=1 Tax=Sphingomonas rhamnosi TaxID=3096156 RepID=UPI002FC6777E